LIVCLRPSSSSLGFQILARAVPELDHPEIREVIPSPNRIVYLRRTEIIEILTVFHASRRIPNLDPGADLI
jgi:plasmid stabilization system protein ParE